MRKTIKTLWSNTFVRGGMFFTFSSFLVSVMNYFFNFITARSLGPKGYSEIIALFSYLSITAVPTVVFSLFVIQKISSAGEKKYVVTESLVELLWNKIKQWWFIIAAILLFSPLIPKITNLSTVTGSLVLPLIILSFVATFYGAAMQGLQLFFLYSLITLLGTFLKLWGGILTSLRIDGIQTILIFIILSLMIPIVASFFLLRSYLKKTVAISLGRTEKRIVSLFYNPQFLLILFSTLALTLLNNIDIVFVKKFFSAQDAGIYSSWSLFSKIIFYAVGPFITISFIFFSTEGSRKHQDKTLTTSLILLGLIGVGSFIFYKLFALFIISVLFGSRFQAVAPYLSQASIFGTFYSAIAFINGYFLAKRSRLALILAALIPFYIFLLFVIQRNLSQIVRLDILFSGFVVVAYLIAYVSQLSHPDPKPLY